MTRGLSSVEAKKKLLTWGKNQVIPSGTFSLLQEIRKILTDPGGMMFLILGLLYWVLGDRTNALILFGAYIPVTAVDALLNIRSGRALKALRETLSLHAKIYRDGTIQDIPIPLIVPDDVMVIEEGQTLPADGLILESSHLQVSEAALTGESMPIEKKTDDLFYAGTEVISGNGLGYIQKTGKHTRYGKIGELLKETIESVSPLRKRIDHLFKMVVLIALFLSVILLIVEWLRSKDLVASLIVACTLGMSAIPEEFPLVFTLYLSLGAWRLSKKRVLVKSLPSVETLGGVDVICTDKTGTITFGKFELEKPLILNASIKENDFWLHALMACEIHPVDPMEIPIVQKAEQLRSALLNWELIHDRAFDPITRTMAHTWKKKEGNETRTAMKGALEGVLLHCKFTEEERINIQRIHDEQTKNGKRILALSSGTQKEFEMTLNGLLIYSDPVRPDVKKAIQNCREAGIEIKMLTGDHLLTAHFIADQIELPHHHSQLYTGDHLSKMTKEEKKRAFNEGSVFARFSPEQKHEMVKALKESGKVVAMTGDGINDAPALRLADIGISMGKSASDVARTTARMVLINNDFSGIVAAVLEGRNVFTNLRKSFCYLISFHIPVILLTMIPPFLGWPKIIMSVHIILLELVVHPVSAISFEKGPQLLEKKTERAKLLSRSEWWRSIGGGLVLSLVCLLLFASQFDQDEKVARTSVFSTILLGNAFFVLTVSYPNLNRRAWITLLFLFIASIFFSSSGIGFELLHFQKIGVEHFLLTIILASLCSIPRMIFHQKP